MKLGLNAISLTEFLIEEKAFVVCCYLHNYYYDLAVICFLIILIEVLVHYLVTHFRLLFSKSLSL